MVTPPPNTTVGKGGVRTGGWEKGWSSGWGGGEHWWFFFSRGDFQSWKANKAARVRGSMTKTMETSISSSVGDGRG